MGLFLSLSGGLEKPFICCNVRMCIQVARMEQLKHSKFLACSTVTDMGRFLGLHMQTAGFFHLLKNNSEFSFC